MHMEFNGEISDTDSGIILHSGSDSPTTHTKDVTTHTRAMKLKHQALQDRLEICILELKKLCLREAELTGQLPDDYPLLPGEKPPQIRRRIGAAFKLDEQSIPQGSKETEMSLVDAELALQLKIYEAARKLCEEHHTSKAVRKSRLQQCKREEKKLKQLQESAFQLRLEHGRSSPLPAFNIAQHDLGTSDDSSLSDSVVQDEEVTSQSSLQSSGLPYPGDTDPPQTQPPPQSSHSFVDGSYASPSAAPQSMQLSSCSSPHPSLESTQSLSSIPDYDLPPIQHSPWTESSLDQPYQKSKKSRSSSKKNTPTKTELLPPLEACLAPTSLPVQLSHLKLSRTQSNSTPSTPEMRVHRQLSLRLSNPESSLDKERGRTRGPRRRLTEYTITVPETLPPPLSYMNPTGSEDSNSEHSFTSYNSSPCQEFPCSSPHQYQPSVLHSSPVGGYGPQVYPRTGFYHNPRHQSSPNFHKAYYNEDMVYPPDLDLARSYYAQPALAPPNRYEYRYKDTAMSHQRAQRPPDVRLSPAPAQWDRPHYRSAGVSQQVVNEQLKSWHRRSQLKAPRSRSLDRQGAVRIKNMAARESSCYVNPKYHEQVVQREILQRSADDSQTHWVVDDGSHYISQL